MKVLALMTQPQGGEGAGLMGLLPFVLIFAVFYFLLIRPQLKKQKQKQKLLESLKKGDKVLTVGGIYGTIEGIKEKGDTLIIKIADNVKVSIARSAVANTVDSNG